MPINVVFLCSWSESPISLLDRYRLQTPNNSGVWNDLHGVDNIESADYFIAMQDHYENSKKIRADKTIYFKREPPWIVNESFERKQALYKFDYDHAYQISVWWVKKTYNELKNIPNKPDKKKLCCIVSGEKECAGHRARLDFIKKCSEVKDLDLDIYGRGLENRGLGDKYKGYCTDKYEVMSEYEYSICMENGQMNNYFSEKLVDSILSWSVPIYWGCPNVDDFFTPGLVKKINILNHSCIDSLFEIISKKPEDNELSDLEKARHLILDKYNLWPSIERAILTGKVL